MRSKKKICFIAQFPPPIHGLSKAVEMLYDSDLAVEYDFEKIDITNNKAIIRNLIKIFKTEADLFYFTISQTKKGNFRDLLILKILDLEKKRCLIHLHGGYYRTLVENMGAWQKKANYKAIGKLEGAIVLGPSLKWNMKGMLPDEKIFMVSNCIDNKYLMSDVDYCKKMDRFDHKKVKHVLYLSNFIREKGYFEVLEMAKLERRRVIMGGKRKFHFDFAGQFFRKADKQFFENFILVNELKEYVTYHGIVDGKKKQELLSQCDFFILLTKYSREGQPISILEAMGNGMFIVTTNHAGIPDIVKESINGIMVDKSDINVQKCYQFLLKKPDIEIKEVIDRNRKMAKKNYNQKAYIENMRKVFAELV